MSTPDVSAEFESYIPSVLVALTLALLFFTSFYFSGFWIDESVTYWVISDSFSEVGRRAFEFQGQSPLYFWFLWIWKEAFGVSESILRMPSLIFLVGSCVLVMRLASDFFGQRARLPALMALLGFSRVQWMLSARPYAFGFFCCMLATLACLRMLEGRGKSWLVCFVLACAGALYGHTLFALFLMVPILLWFFDTRRPRKLSLVSLLSYLLISLLLFFPGFLQLQNLAKSRAILEFDVLPPLFEVIAGYFPRTITIAFIATIIFARFVLRGVSFDLKAFRSRRLYTILLWYIAPPLLLYSLCVLTGTTVFKSRYYVWNAAAFAIAYGGFVAAFAPAAMRLIALILLSAALLLQQLSAGFADEGWKSAVELANTAQLEQKLSLVVQPGLVESRELAWIHDQRRSQYLLSPLAFYRLEAAPKVLPLSVLTDEARSFVAAVLSSSVNEKGEVLLLAYRPSESLKQAFSELGYSPVRYLQRGMDVELILLGRSPVEPIPLAG